MMTLTLQFKRWISRACFRASSGLIFTLALITVTAPQSLAQTYTVLYSFLGAPDGQDPSGAPVVTDNGIIYGLTAGGGASRACGFGCGALFRLDSSGNDQVLTSFNGAKGGTNPTSGLIRDSTGNFYGTTHIGGIPGAGTVFKISKGKETVLHNFTGGSDGANPDSGVIRDAEGNLYGTAEFGGAKCFYYPGCGVIFKINKSGVFKVLYSFPGGTSTGQFPFGGLVQDPSGNLYGTANTGGVSACGNVFKASGTLSVLYSFTGVDGCYPVASLTRDASGNLYGPASEGGAYSYGAVFKLDTTGKETVLYSFNGPPDANYPSSSVILDSAGNIYGVTLQGGANGQGTVYKLDSKGNETILYNFTGQSDGGFPHGLTMDKSGNLYGMTAFGGKGNGVVFKLTLQ